MNKLLAGLIVTFYPSDLQIKSIANLSKSFDELFIIDNSCSSKVKKSLIELNKPNIKIIFNKKNYGIGYSANKFIKELRGENLYEWALMLDQDSIINFNLRNLTKKITNSQNQIVGLNFSEKKIITKDYEIPKYIKVTRIIQSGTFIRKSIYMKYLYDDNYFLDFTDFDFCARLIQDGIQIYKIGNYYLQHFVGETQINKFLIFKRKRSNHPPINCFFMARNRIIMNKKNLYDTKLIKIIFRQMKEILLTFLYENNSFKKNKARIKGIISGVTNRRFSCIDDVKIFLK